MFFLNTSRDLKLRYDMAKFMEFVEIPGDLPRYDILFSYFINHLKGITQGGVFQVNGEDNRPELISWKIYNSNTQYWWILLFYNDLTNNEDISPEILKNMKLIYPLLPDLESLYFQLNSLRK